ncbi:hypothetical protein [Streptomyces sp. NPDC058812]|uniref:hypothetical protein n=1 Tax=unclassified Streptomyces TaxID=2593676 RepID=UPI0036BEDF21
MTGNVEAAKTADPETSAKEPAATTGDSAEKRHGGDRSAYVAAGAVVAACLSLVLYGILGTEDDAAPEQQKTPTAAVTYEVAGEGSVEVSYLAHGSEGRAKVETDVEMPWKKTVHVPLGKRPTISILLDGEGGQARCLLAIRGEHVQGATASGAYGRATCAGELPAPRDPTSERHNDLHAQAGVARSRNHPDIGVAPSSERTRAYGAMGSGGNLSG